MISFGALVRALAATLHLWVRDVLSFVCQMVCLRRKEADTSDELLERMVDGLDNGGSACCDRSSIPQEKKSGVAASQIETRNLDSLPIVHWCSHGIEINHQLSTESWVQAEIRRREAELAAELSKLDGILAERQAAELAEASFVAMAPGHPSPCTQDNCAAPVRQSCFKSRSIGH